MKFLTKKWAETQFQNFANKINSIFVKSNDLSTVSFSGDYNDLSEKPNIPTKISELENDVEYAKTKSPTLTGIPKAPTPSSDTNNTQIATTAFVKTLISNLINGAPETLDTLKEIADALGENKDVVDALEEAISKKANTTDMTAALNNKVDKISGKGLSTNDYTTAEKTKLSGIVEGANKYVHPTTSGNKHIPAGGSSGKILGWSAAGTAEWKDPPSATGNYLPLAGGSMSGGIIFQKMSPFKTILPQGIAMNYGVNGGLTNRLLIDGLVTNGIAIYKKFTIDAYNGATYEEIDLSDEKSNTNIIYLFYLHGSSSTASYYGNDDDWGIWVVPYVDLPRTNDGTFRYRPMSLYHNSPATSRFSLGTSNGSNYLKISVPKGSAVNVEMWRFLDIAKRY